MMSKIDDLIAKYCPNGVEYKSLADLEDNGFIKLGRGNVISKNDLRDNPGDYPVYSSSATGNGALGYYSKYMFDDERLSWSIDGGGRFFYRPKHKYSITNVCGWLKVLNETRLSTKYLFYVLTNEWVKKVFDYTKKAHPSVIRKEYTIPVPPLAVQEEIVNILDSFTLLEAELKAELEAELVARKQQYEHYRDELLNPKNMNGDVKIIRLGDVAEVYDGTHTTPHYTESGIKFVSVENINDLYATTKHISVEDYNKYKTKPQINDVFMTRIGSIGSCAVVNKNEDLAYYVSLALIRPNTKQILSKYVKYVIESKTGQRELAKRTLVTAVPIKINLSEIGKIQIPVPSLDEQERIVAILDKFDALVNDISEGLPAEINARRQQYEYYRDKLLSFPMAA